MHIVLPAKIAKRLACELRRAGRQEIGGLLMGEHIGEARFRIVDISVQRAGGTDVCFVREPREHRAQLDQFFANTGRDYTRFNYLGEWHSHPSFVPLPSSKDSATMQSLVQDDVVGVNFVVLLIASFTDSREMVLSATAYRAGADAVQASVTIDEDTTDGEWHNRLLPRWLRTVFRRH
jgi:integrative and conjugative element protein (TIGR02256 family)